jgi:hypothetical protein
MGENLAYSTRGIKENFTALWYSEKMNYKYEGADPRPANFFSVGHFTQVVWKSSTKIGIGFSGMYCVANYLPAGNFFGQFEKNVLPE